MKREQLIIIGVLIVALVGLGFKLHSGISLQNRGGTSQVSVSDSPPHDWPTDSFFDAQDAAEQYDLLIVGDIAFGENYFNAKGSNDLTTNGYEYYLSNFDELLSSVDATVGVLSEALIDDPGQSKNGRLDHHWSSATKVPALLEAKNITALSLANPHLADFGEEGLLRTLEALDARNISYFGAGRDSKNAGAPFFIEASLGSKSFKVAFFGVSSRVPTSLRAQERPDPSSEEEGSPDAGGLEGAPDAGESEASPYIDYLNLREIEERVRQLSADEPETLIVVYPSWGRQRSWNISRQRGMGRRFIESGADLVIGTGSHMIQQIDEHESGFIFQNLGDFVFNGEISEGERDAVPYSGILKMTAFLDEEENVRVRLRLYPTVTYDSENEISRGRYVNVTEYGDFYQSQIIKSWVRDDPWLKRELGMRSDQFGRYFLIGHPFYR